MIFARVDNKKYSVAWLTKTKVEIISSTPEEGFAPINSHLFSKWVPIDEISSLYIQQTYCLYKGIEHIIVCHNENSFYITLPGENTIVEVCRCEISDINEKISNLIEKVV